MPLLPTLAAAAANSCSILLLPLPVLAAVPHTRARCPLSSSVPFPLQATVIKIGLHAFMAAVALWNYAVPPRPV